MSDTLESLRRKINSAAQLESVVRTMKALAASSIGQYEAAVISLNDYYRAVELGLSVCLKHVDFLTSYTKPLKAKSISTVAIVFSSDQGLVGQFNETLTDWVSATLKTLPGNKKIWVVGERILGHIEDAGLSVANKFEVPGSVNTITALVRQILMKAEKDNLGELTDSLYIFHNSPEAGSVYRPVSQRLLPLDEVWLKKIASVEWPGPNLPEAIGGDATMLYSLVREYLFVSLYRSCAESLAAENAARLAAMRRAEKNIGDLKDSFQLIFNRLRQSAIDEELFDLISGSEALSDEKMPEKE